uniref:Clp R domain-containing protein n=1 Tax=Oryza glumipatula TaxID=40148 RepID=A0A0D9YZG7_9ORYZ
MRPAYVIGAGADVRNVPPPLSNALAAALKRAYAHHRRIGSGVVEADDHRVGVPHLVLAILDDPSVARVMREASFSSTAVKAAMLRSLSDPAAPDSGVYVNARVLHRQVSHREEEVNKVVEVLKRGKKRNPVLVGDTVDVDAVVQEVVTMIQRQRLGNARVISFQREFGDLVDLDRAELAAKIKELGEAIRSELLSPASRSAGVVVNLGNLQWLVEERCVAPGEQEKRRDVVLDTARAAVAEMARILRQSGEREHRVWVIGTATCATYLKCQVYHPSLESEWDLQAVPITPRPPPPPPSSLGLSPSVNGVNRGILSSSVEVLSSAMTTSAMQSRSPSLCSACLDGYERERADMAWSPGCGALHATEQPMSQWLQIGTPSSARPPFDRAQDKAREADELRRRWLDRCAQLHSHGVGGCGGGRPSSMVTCSEWNGASVLANMQAIPLLVKRLTEAVRWQPEAAAAVAAAITKARSGERKRRGMGPTRADTWVLFSGHDVAGKTKMAEALSMSVFGTNAVALRLAGNGGEPIASCRGRTALDCVADAIRANPLRVIVLDGFDHHDDDRVVQASILRAVESGRLVDSRGRDVALGEAIFVVMSLDDTRRCQEDHQFTDSPWNLELRVRNNARKRRPEPQPLDGAGDRRLKPRKDSPPLHLDLNLSMCEDHTDDDDSGGEESRNSSSDLTVEHEQEYGQPAAAAAKFSAPSSFSELTKAVDATVVFKPVDFGPLKRSVSDVVSAKLGDAAGAGAGLFVHVDDGVLDRLAGAAWTAGESATSLEAWADEVLCPTIRQLKRSLSANDVDGATTVSLSAVEGSGDRRRKDGEVFPTSVTVAVDGN